MKNDPGRQGERWLFVIALPMLIPYVVLGWIAFDRGLYYVVAGLVIIALVMLAAAVYGLTHDPPPTPPLVPNDHFTSSKPFDAEDRRITKRGS